MQVEGGSVSFTGTFDCATPTQGRRGAATRGPVNTAVGWSSPVQDCARFLEPRSPCTTKPPTRSLTFFALVLESITIVADVQSSGERRKPGLSSGHRACCFREEAEGKRKSSNRHSAIAGTEAVHACATRKVSRWLCFRFTVDEGFFCFVSCSARADGRPLVVNCLVCLVFTLDFCVVHLAVALPFGTRYVCRGNALGGPLQGIQHLLATRLRQFARAVNTEVGA